MCDVDARLADARRQVADLRSALRVAERELTEARVRVEQAAIDAVGGQYGRNAEERERYLQRALLDSQRYQETVRAADQLRARLDQAQAELDILLDAQRERRLRLLERQVALLERRALVDVFSLNGAEP